MLMRFIDLCWMKFLRIMILSAYQLKKGRFDMGVATLDCNQGQPNSGRVYRTAREPLTTGKDSVITSTHFLL